MHVHQAAQRVQVAGIALDDLAEVGEGLGLLPRRVRAVCEVEARRGVVRSQFYGLAKRGRRLGEAALVGEDLAEVAPPLRVVGVA